MVSSSDQEYLIFQVKTSFMDSFYESVNVHSTPGNLYFILFNKICHLLDRGYHVIFFKINARWHIQGNCCKIEYPPDAVPNHFSGNLLCKLRRNCQNGDADVKFPDNLFAI